MDAFKIEYYDTDEQFGAEAGKLDPGKLYARTGSREDGYVFAVNLEKMQEVWSASVLAELLSLKSFMDAFIISELSVLKYGAAPVFDRLRRLSAYRKAAKREVVFLRLQELIA